MANYVNVLDILDYTILNGGSQYLTDEDLWFWDYHLSRPHTTPDVAFVPQYALNQIDPSFREVNTTGLSENLMLSTNDYLVTSDYIKGTFLFSRTTKNLYYLDIPTATVAELPKTGTIPTLIEGSAFSGKLLEYRAISNHVYYADTADQILYRYDVSGTIWQNASAFPTGWAINSNTSKEITLLCDQVSNDLYLLTRNLYVISAGNKTIYYNYRAFKFDVAASVWVEVLPEGSFDLYQFGVNPAETTQSPGRCMVHNGKLYVYNLFTEAFPSGSKGRVTYLSSIVINLGNRSIEKNDWTPVYHQATNCTAPIQCGRYGNYFVLITPDCPNLSFLINPANNKVANLRVALGLAQGTNTIRTGSLYSVCSVPTSQLMYDFRERKEYPLAWTNAQLVADYSFADQIYTDSIQIDANDSNGMEVYIDVGTGAYQLSSLSFNAQSNVITANVKTYLKRFRITYTLNSNNADAEIYKIRVMTDPTHIWVVNSANNRIDSDQFSNIIVGTPTASRVYKIQNKTGYTTTAVRVFIEADGDSGSYFTEISAQSDTGYLRHCKANTGAGCTKGFSWGKRECASGRCGGYEKDTLLPIPQALPPNQTALFYVRINVPAGQTRINRQARIVTQLEY